MNSCILNYSMEFDQLFRIFALTMILSLFLIPSYALVLLGLV